MKIVLASDFLMTSEIEQNSNLQWLSDALRECFHDPVYVCSNKFPNRINFNRLYFFNLSNIEINSNVTHFDFDINNINAKSMEYIKNIFEDCLVIGYELSDKTKSILNKTGTPYIDIWLGPVRFLDDITFNIGSNIDEVLKRIQDYRIDDDLITANAKLIKIQFYRGFNRIKYYYPKGSALFAGQLTTDKAILRDGKMLTVLDFKTEFSEICSKHTKVFYSRHPFIKDQDLEVMKFVSKFHNVEILNKDIPTYSILSDENITKVFGISSSVIFESKFFGKEINYLYKPPFDFNEYTCISQCLLFKTFWDHILSDLRTDLAEILKSNPFYLGKDKLRNSLSFYWGYRSIDKLEYYRSHR